MLQASSDLATFEFFAQPPDVPKQVVVEGDVAGEADAAGDVDCWGACADRAAGVGGRYPCDCACHADVAWTRDAAAERAARGGHQQQGPGEWPLPDRAACSAF